MDHPRCSSFGTQPGGNILLLQGVGTLSCNLPWWKSGQENRGHCGESPSTQQELLHAAL